MPVLDGARSKNPPLSPPSRQARSTICVQRHVLVRQKYSRRVHGKTEEGCVAQGVLRARQKGLGALHLAPEPGVPHPCPVEMKFCP